MANELGAKQSPNSGGYNYNYGGAYAGYSAIGYGEGNDGGQMQRTLKDYLLIIRERIWYIVVVFIVVLSSVTVFTLGETKLYQSSATVQIFRRNVNLLPGTQAFDSEVRSTEDLNTQVKLMESIALVRRVAERIKGDDLRAFLAPYEKSPAELASVPGILARNRKVLPQRLTLVVTVSYQHPDRIMAAKVANLFVDEYLKSDHDVRDSYQKDITDALLVTVADQRKKVDLLAKKLQDYKENNKTVSLDQRKDIVSESLKSINLEVQKTGIALQTAETRLNQIKDYRAKGAELTGLSFVASQKNVADLLDQVATQKIQIAKLKEIYRDKHPNMIAAKESFDQTQRELERAVNSVCDQVESEYLSAATNHKLRQQELDRIKAESLELDRVGVDYSQIEREFQTENQILQNTVAHFREISMTNGFESQSARVVDTAVPSSAGSVVSPNVPLNLGVGVVGGLGLGLAFAFFVAFIDDRVKSSFDIEGVIGLPLIGIIPQIKKLDPAEKAQIVATNADRQVAEAFLTLHSSLRLKDESKNAKCILITSTIPGEGKSFATTNLALTFAAHGERVVIVDCDLRKPNIHKTFKVENLKGVIDISAGNIGIDGAVVRNVQPNLDIIPAGGRAKNPTQILNSKGFEDMIIELRKRYDRVFIDTPPLAAVSDALIMLPLVDGSIFTIYFNKVRRKAAQFSSKQLLESNVPNFGAILNGLNLAVSGYYYAQYYDKSYKDYYVTMAKQEGSEEK